MHRQQMKVIFMVTKIFIASSFFFFVIVVIVLVVIQKAERKRSFGNKKIAN